MTAILDRFPGLDGAWARFDGPAGTLMVDTAIEAMRTQVADGSSANVGGAFAASQATGALVERARRRVAQLLGTTADGVVFGANMTTLTFAFTRAVMRRLRPGDEVVCTQLDHDANVTPWVLASQDRGAKVVLAELDPATGRLPVEAITARLSERTRWVAVTGASNLIGTMTDLGLIVDVAHEAGARVYVDAVHLVPHRRVDVSSIGCDALVTSPYKWYGPHAGVLVLDTELLAELEPYRVRPAPDEGPGRLETGTPSFEAIAGIDAAAQFLLEDEAEHEAHEASVFSLLLDGLQSMAHVQVHGPRGLERRAPTVLFTVTGRHPADVADRLATERIAVWSGHSYAVETARALGLGEIGGVRAGVVRYNTEADVQRLLRTVDGLR